MSFTLACILLLLEARGGNVVGVPQRHLRIAHWPIITCQELMHRHAEFFGHCKYIVARTRL